MIDLDGTLWDSAVWQASLMESDPQDQAALARLLSHPERGTNAVTALADRKITKKKFSELCASGISELGIYKDAIHQLESASEKVRLGVVTSLPGWIARPMLDGIGVSGLFEVVQTATWGVPNKPSPASLNRALHEIEGEADQTLYLGDSLVDQKAASAAGMHFGWAAWGYGQAVDPDIRLESWRDLQDLL